MAIAVAGNGRPKAAVGLGVLTCLAIAANWSHTLGAIAYRNAGTEAESAKASATIADARDELASIVAERKALPGYTPVTADDVAAARAAVTAAEQSRRRRAPDYHDGRRRQPRRALPPTALSIGRTVGVSRTQSAVANLQLDNLCERGAAGPSGGYLTPGERCAFAVRNCVRPSILRDSRQPQFGDRAVRADGSVMGTRRS